MSSLGESPREVSSAEERVFGDWFSFKDGFKDEHEGTYHHERADAINAGVRTWTARYVESHGITATLMDLSKPRHIVALLKCDPATGVSGVCVTTQGFADTELCSGVPFEEAVKIAEEYAAQEVNPLTS